MRPIDTTPDREAEGLRKGGKASDGDIHPHWQVSEENPLLSIIVLTLNSEEFVGDCLHSLAPLDRRTEVLLVDGGSRDSTLATVRKDFPEIALRLAPGSTIPQARNLGLREASGDYVLYLDSDERLRADALGALLDCLEAEEPAFVVTHHARINRAGESIGVRVIDYPDPYGGLLQNPVSTLGMVCRRELLTSLGGFSETYRMAEDYDLWLRVFEVARGRRLEVYLGEHRVREDSASQSDILRMRLFGAKAAMAAARRRRMPLHVRALILGYWALFLVDGLPIALRFRGRSGWTERRIWKVLRSQLRDEG